jgi:hypothetical protein
MLSVTRVAGACGTAAGRRVVPNSTEAILYFVTGAFVGLALAMTVHSVKSDLQTDNKFRLLSKYMFLVNCGAGQLKPL